MVIILIVIFVFIVIFLITAKLRWWCILNLLILLIQIWLYIIDLIIGFRIISFKLGLKSCTPWFLKQTTIIIFLAIYLLLLIFAKHLLIFLYNLIKIIRVVKIKRITNLLVYYIACFVGRGPYLWIVTVTIAVIFYFLILLL
jgi:hypothetical protein